MIFRAHSSAGSEHLPYKQGVIGSNPIGPTLDKKRNTNVFLFFCVILKYSRDQLIRFSHSLSPQPSLGLWERLAMSHALNSSSVLNQDPKCSYR